LAVLVDQGFVRNQGHLGRCWNLFAYSIFLADTAKHIDRIFVGLVMRGVWP
jgi:hypothetical protein